jgi:hypothetical protein
MSVGGLSSWLGDLTALCADADTTGDVLGDRLFMIVLFMILSIVFMLKAGQYSKLRRVEDFDEIKLDNG